MKADQDLLGRVELVEERTNIALGRTGNAGPGGAGPMTTFVYRPGGVTSGNVFGGAGTAGWAPLVAACFQTQGPKIVEFDGTLNGNACTIPAGVWTMSRVADVTFVGTGGADQVLDVGLPVVTVANGASFPGVVTPTCVGTLRNLQIVWAGSASPIIVASTALGGCLIEVDNVFFNVAGSTAPFMQSTGTGIAEIELYFSTALNPSGTAVIGAADTSVLVVLGGYAAFIPANTTTTAAGATLLLQVGGASSTVSPFQLGAGATPPTYFSPLAHLVANRVFGSVVVNGGVAPGTGGILTANGSITRKATGKYRLNYLIVASNAALGDMTLTFQAATAAVGLAAATTFTHTITVPANGNKVSFSGSLIFDGAAGSPNGGAVLPADATGKTFFNFAITAGAGNFTTASQVGVVSLEECG